MEGNVKIGPIIKKIQKEKGVSVKDFAKALHCGRGNIYQ